MMRRRRGGKCLFAEPTHCIHIYYNNPLPFCKRFFMNKQKNSYAVCTASVKPQMPHGQKTAEKEPDGVFIRAFGFCRLLTCAEETN